MSPTVHFHDVALTLHVSTAHEDYLSRRALHFWWVPALPLIHVLLVIPLAAATMGVGGTSLSWLVPYLIGLLLGSFAAVFGVTLCGVVLAFLMVLLPLRIHFVGDRRVKIQKGHVVMGGQRRPLPQVDPYLVRVPHQGLELVLWEGCRIPFVVEREAAWFISAVRALQEKEADDLAEAPIPDALLRLRSAARSTKRELAK